MIDKLVNLKPGVQLGEIGKFNKKHLTLLENDRFKHEYIIGHDGCGKDTFILNQAIQDIENGNGFCFIDQYGDFVEELLKYIPKERAKDVIYFDAADKERPIGLNIFDINTPDEIEFVVNETTNMFISIYGPEIFGPRIEEYFKYGSMAILEDFEDKPTIFDVVRMFTDDGYREYKIKKVRNPIVLGWRARTYNAMGDREMEEIIPYFSSKFVQFQTNPNTRNIIGQTKSGFNMDDVVNNKKILLVNLNKGLIGDTDSRLIGKTLLFKLNLALKNRARMKNEELIPFFLYLNNFPAYLGRLSYESFLKDATRCKLGVIMSHQYGEQLKNEYSFQKITDMSQMILNTVGTICIFKLGALDSENFEREVYPTFSKKDLKKLEPNQGIIKINSKPTLFFIEQRVGQVNNQIPPILKEYSSKKYGRRLEFIEAEIRARLGEFTGMKTETQDDSLHDRDNYNISKKMLKNDPDLIDLILGSQSSWNIKEKQSRFDLYPLMNKGQIEKLKNILVTEKEQIRMVEKDKTNKKKRVFKNLKKN